MNRRDALKALTTLAGATGMSVTPVTTQEAERCTLVLIRAAEAIGEGTAARIRAHFRDAVKGTELEDVAVIVAGNGLQFEFVRGSQK